MSFDSAQKASSVLGCDGDELHTAVFKHHLRQLLQRATTGGSRERTAAEAEEGETRQVSPSPHSLVVYKKTAGFEFRASGLRVGGCVCRSQADRRPVSGRNGRRALRGTLHHHRLSN